MTPTDLKLEQLYKSMAECTPPKGSDTITTFNRDIFLYDRDGVNRQLSSEATLHATYEDHRLAVETAVNMLGASTQHTIALTILFNRHFADYRAKAFAGLGCFTDDYSFLLRKIGPLFSATSATVTTSTIASQLQQYTTPALVQINHIAGTVTPVTLPTTSLTLSEWVRRFMAGAPESTTYRIAGLTLG